MENSPKEPSASESVQAQNTETDREQRLRQADIIAEMNSLSGKSARRVSIAHRRRIKIVRSKN